MTQLSVYILSVAGVTILTVLVELILPEGKLHKFTKSILALIMVFVIAGPLPKLVKNGFNLDFESANEVSQDVLNTVKNQQILTLQKNLEKGLEEKGFKNINLTIDADFNSGALKISTIFVDLSNLVLTDETQHIFKTEAVEDFLLKQTGLKAGQVVFYD